MVYGYCTGFSTEPRFKLGIELLEMIRRTGFDYVEFPMMNFFEMSEIEFSKLVETVDRYALRGPAACNFFPGNVHLVGKDVDTKKISSYLDVVLPRCEALGIKKIILGSGPARTFGSDQTKEEAKNQFESILKETILQKTKAFEMLVCIEPFARSCCNLIVSVLEGLEVVKAVNDPDLMLMVDLYHMLSNGEPFSSLAEAFPYIKHVHVAGSDRLVPEDKDIYIWKALDILKKLGYEGSVSLETEKASDATIIRALEMIKKHIREDE